MKKLIKVIVSFNVRDDINQRLNEYCNENGLVKSRYIESAILEKLKKDKAWKSK